MLEKKYSNTKNARLLDCSIAVIFLFLAAISFTGCADSFINNKGSVLIHVPYGAESNARNAGTEGDKYFCVFGFIFSNGNSKTVEAKSGENVSLTDIPLGKITIDVKAYLINEDKTVGYPDFPVYTGTTEDTVKAGENSIAIVLKNTGMVSLELLGAPRVLKESELADYGITETSVPPKMNGFKYVTFGVFPQTIMAEGVKVADGSQDVNGGVAIKND